MFQEHGIIEDFNLARESGANLLAKKEDGGCIYLVNNQCGIHTDRPEVCRDFFCTTKAKKFGGMVKIIKKADKEKISSIYLN